MRIAILTGGSTDEREVSIISAKYVAEVLTFAFYERFVFPEDRERFVSYAPQFDLAIPMIHGRGGEDGEVQRLCQSLGVPFLFSPIEAHRIGIDKILAKEFATRSGIHTPKLFSLSNAVFPVFVKPRFGGSSVHTARVEDHTSLVSFMKTATEEMMIEGAVSGREFTVGVVEQNPGDPEALPVIEIRPRSGFFDYQSKYNTEQLAQEICPAQIDRDLSQRLQSAALAMHTVIGATNLSRSDFIVSDSGDISFLEINTIPGLTGTSLIPKALAAAKIDFSKLLEVWCQNRKDS